jgi:hypothetical protein
MNITHKGHKITLVQKGQVVTARVEKLTVASINLSEKKLEDLIAETHKFIDTHLVDHHSEAKQANTAAVPVPARLG